MVRTRVNFHNVTTIQPIFHFGSEKYNVSIRRSIILVPEFRERRLPRQLQPVLDYGEKSFSGIDRFIEIVSVRAVKGAVHHPMGENLR